MEIELLEVRSLSPCLPWKHFAKTGDVLEYVYGDFAEMRDATVSFVGTDEGDGPACLQAEGPKSGPNKPDIDEITEMLRDEDDEDADGENGGILFSGNIDDIESLPPDKRKAIKGGAESVPMSSSPPQASVYVFNNLVSDVSGIVALKMDSVCWDDPWLKASIPLGSPSFRLRNNVFLCDAPFFNQGSSVPPKFRAGANVFTAARTGDYPPADAVGEEGSLFGARPVFRDVARGDFRLAPDSPGASDGLSLDACCDSAATPSGASAFAGLDALPRGLLGTEGKTPDGPVSGLWEIFRKDARLGERTDPYTDDSGQVVAPKWGVHAVFADYLRLP